MSSWTIRNLRGLNLLGDTHLPKSEPKACVILMHGFKGYKDYGFIPVLAHDLCDSGMIVHRFNFSTSGMTNDIETFARPDLFELDTWNRQVEDVRRVVQAVRSDELAGNGLPIFLIGHSRGGGTALLTAGRHGEELNLGGVITLSAVDACCRMSKEDQAAMLARGYSITQSARTKQDLKISSAWLQEQIDDPDAHNILELTKQITCPLCVIHGEDDQAVGLKSGHNIADVHSTTCHIIKGANHVLNMSNPSDIASDRSPQLLEATGTITRFISEHT